MKHILNKKLLLLLPLVIFLALLFYIYPSKTKVKYPNLKGKHLTAYVALREQEAKALLEKFKKETGCTYEYIKLPTEEAVKRILAESENPSGDIFIGGTCDAYELLKANGALAKYESPNAKKIPSEYKDSSNYWTGFKIDTLAIGINKEVWDKEFKPKGIKLPTDFDDLLKKEFKNKIIIPSPETSGTGYTNIISITPKDTGWNVDSVAEIKNSSNKEVAEAFIDFILSDDIANSLSTYSNSISTKRSNDITNNIYQDYSFKDAATERNTIMKMFNDSNSK